MAKNQRGVVVAYRVVPGEPDQSVIVDNDPCIKGMINKVSYLLLVEEVV